MNQKKALNGATLEGRNRIGLNINKNVMGTNLSNNNLPQKSDGTKKLFLNCQFCGKNFDYAEFFTKDEIISSAKNVGAIMEILEGFEGEILTPEKSRILRGYLLGILQNELVLNDTINRFRKSFNIINKNR